MVVHVSSPPASSSCPAFLPPCPNTSPGALSISWSFCTNMQGQVYSFQGKNLARGPGPEWWWMEVNLSGDRSHTVFPRGWYWSQPCLIYLLMIWIREFKAPSVRLQMTPSWQEVFICLSIGRSYRGTWTCWMKGLSQWDEAQQDQVLGPALWSQQPHGMLDCPLLLSTGESAL